MCQPKSDGGRRCAAHTRPGFEAAVTAFNTAATRKNQQEVWIAQVLDVAEHAATPAGASEVETLRQFAIAGRDSSLAGFLATGQDMAGAINDRREAVAVTVAPKRPSPAEPAPTDPSPDTWDPGTPSLEVGAHWSIAEGGTRWHEGGCGAFAIALHERWPHLKIACEIYRDHGQNSVAHAWAYDPATNTRFHILGAEPWTPTTRPDYDPDSHAVLLDQSPGDVRALFRGNNCSEDTVMDGMEVACEMFDPNYQPPEPLDPDDEFGDDRSHLYF